MTRVKVASQLGEPPTRKVTPRAVKKPASPNSSTSAEEHLEQTPKTTTNETLQATTQPSRFLVPNLKVKRALGKGMLCVFEVINILTGKKSIPQEPRKKKIDPFFLDKSYAAKIYPTKTTIQSAHNEFTLMKHVHKCINDLREVPVEKREGLSALVSPSASRHILKAYHKLDVSEKEVLLLELFVDVGVAFSAIPLGNTYVTFSRNTKNGNQGNPLETYLTL